MNTRKGLTGIVSIILLLAISIALTSVLFYSVTQYDFTSDDITNPTVSYNPATDKYTLIKNPDNVPVGVGSTDDNNLNKQFASVGDSLTATNAVLAKTGDSLTVIRDESDSNSDTSNFPTFTDFSEPSSSSPDNIGQIHSSMSGNGTQSNPYIITNDTQLQSVKHEPNQNYKLGNNINASLTNNWNGGSGFNPYRFEGVLDGNGHAIKSIYIDRTGRGIGLVGVNTGVIKNLAVINASVNGGDRGGNAVIAGINRGIVSTVFASGSVSGELGVGGIVGDNGFPDDLPAGTINNSYANVDVTGNRAVGGVVGNNNDGSIVKNSYSVGNVTGGNRVGGAIGGKKVGGSIEDVFWDEVSSGQSSSGSGVTSTTGFNTDSDGDGRADEMIGASAASNMTGFDFTNVWKTVPNEYPRLRNLNGQG